MCDRPRSTPNGGAYVSAPQLSNIEFGWLHVPYSRWQGVVAIPMHLLLQLQMIRGTARIGVECPGSQV